MPPRYAVHPEHIRSLASMPLRYTVHPEHIRSLASMPSRYTVHLEHKKTSYFSVTGFYILLINLS